METPIPGRILALIAAVVVALVLPITAAVQGSVSIESATGLLTAWGDQNLQHLDLQDNHAAGATA